MKTTASSRLTCLTTALLILQMLLPAIPVSTYAKTFYAGELFQKPVIKQRKPAQIKPKTRRPVIKQVPKAKRQIKPKPVSIKTKIKPGRIPAMKSPKPRVRLK